MNSVDRSHNLKIFLILFSLSINNKHWWLTKQVTKIKLTFIYMFFLLSILINLANLVIISDDQFITMFLTQFNISDSKFRWSIKFNKIWKKIENLFSLSKFLQIVFVAEIFLVRILLNRFFRRNLFSLSNSALLSFLFCYLKKKKTLFTAKFELATSRLSR